MGLVALEILSPYLSMHINIIQIRDCTRHVHQFEGKMVLDHVIDSKSDSTIPISIGSPPWRAHLLGYPAPS
jgi:hypothetical protein